MAYDWEETPKKFSIWRVLGILLLILALGMLIWYGISKLTKKVPAPTEVVSSAVSDVVEDTPLSFLAGESKSKASELFSDVTDETPHAEDIAWLYDAGITKGFEDGTFRGEELVNRQDLAAFLYRMAGSPEYQATAEDVARFVDLDELTPHYNEICWMATQGITAGYPEPDGTYTFRGTELVTRQDLAAFLRRLTTIMGGNAEMAADTPNPFADVVMGVTPHAEDIVWLASTGVTAGYTEADGTKTFRGDQPVTRQDMAAFLHRLSDFIQQNK